MTVNIKKCFVSRWGNDGYIVEADFSQLEVIGAAEISGDPMMRKDILDGIDSHSQSAAWLNPEYSYEDIRGGYLDGDVFFTKLRKNAKAPRFELQYGAGATSIAENNKISIEAAQGFIDRYYQRYSVLKDFQDRVMATVQKSRVPTGEHTPRGNPQGIGTYISQTGRIYAFLEQDAPSFLQRKGVLTSFSPTQCKNYPIQGFATGDIVPEVVGRLMRRLQVSYKLREKCLMINTVHDSIIFDVHKSELNLACRQIKTIMEDAPVWMKQRFGIEITLPMNVDVEYGTNWYELKQYEF